jgi:hypothetical protein
MGIRIQYNGSTLFPSRAVGKREKVYFKNLPEHVKLKQARPVFAHNHLRDNAGLNEYLLDKCLLRTYKSRAISFCNPLHRTQPGSKEEAVKAVEHLQHWLHTALNARKLAFPLSMIRQDNQITPEAKATCYEMLWRAYYADQKQETSSCFSSDLDKNLRAVNAFIEKYYLITRFFPEMLEQADINLSFNFSQGVFQIESELLERCFWGRINGFVLPLWFMRFGENAYMPIVHPKYPLNIYLQIIAKQSNSLRNIVLV